MLPSYKTIRKPVRNALRFLNLLEPDLPYMVLSLSKLSVWATLGLSVYVIATGQSAVEVGAALTANMGAIGNYAYRRKLQKESCTAGYATSPVCDADIPVEGE